MAKFNIELAGQIVEINSLHGDIESLCNDYRIEKLCKEPDIVVEIEQHHIEHERELSIKEAEYEGHPYYDFTDGYLETLAVYRQIATAMLDRDTLLFHGSAVAVDGQAYIFTALSGTGKSTHRRLWQQLYGNRVTVVNDDKPLLTVHPDKEGRQRAYVCGTPWDGKHRVSENVELPLRAICILERGEENEIHEIKVAEAIPSLMIQSYRPKDPELMLKSLAIIDKIVQNVKLYRLRCNMDIDAARVSYEGMCEK